MNRKSVILISFDAVSARDLDKLSEMKNFSELMKNGSVIKKVDSVYPSLTYPAHATIMTGRYPLEHGVINNTFLEINNNKPNWYWYSKYIKSDTVYDLALKKGLTVASILWPTTAGSEITYNMPEIHCNKSYDNQIIKSIFAGSVFYQYKMNKRFGHLREGVKEPMLDDFAVEVTKATIKEKKPNLLLLHLLDVDYQKHSYGTESIEVDEALERHDRRLGEIIDTLKECGIYDDTTIIILGDHSQCDVKYAIRLNSIFTKEGLISVNNNRIEKHKVIAKSCDGSSYIYCTDKKIEDKVYKILINLQNQENSPIKEIYTDTDIIRLGADIKSSFMVEAKEGYYFVDGTEGEFVSEIDKLSEDEHKVRACHGYIHTKDDYKTFFMASGKDIKKGIALEHGKLINHGPTIAKILGLNLEDATGIPEERILEDEVLEEKILA